MATPQITRTQLVKRRSTRIALSASVRLTGQDHQNCPFTMPAKATNLNRCGAAIHLPRQLLVGSTIMLRNVYGTEVIARVVAELSSAQRLSAYGIEFAEQDDTTNKFWGITFPPLESRAAHAGGGRRKWGSSASGSFS